ncbi:TrmH family RNA methyltransferase [Jatrophihabitans sp. DSM 45814]
MRRHSQLWWSWPSRQSRLRASAAPSLPTPPERSPSQSVLSDSNARLVAARRLTGRRNRHETGRFLVEGAQAVREALDRPEIVVELFATEIALLRYADLVSIARSRSIVVEEISEKAAMGLSETVTPQGLIAVCHIFDLTFESALSRRPSLAAVLVEANEPGNAGAILRTADAAGASLVILAGDAVDLYNGKTVRASAGSIFHLDVVTGTDPEQVVLACRRSGLLTLATTGGGTTDLDILIDDGSLSAPTAWLFGNEARGLPESVLEVADAQVRVPVYGRAESLNLAAAAAICLYSSARAQRVTDKR